MFKKLFNNLVGNNEETTPTQNVNETSPEVDNDVSDDVEEEVVVTNNFSGTVVYDPITLHGTHYDVTDYDNEVTKRAEKWIASERESDPNFSQADVDNVYINYKREVYCEWNHIARHDDQMMKWENAQRNASVGISTSGVVTEDPNDPLLAPVHGLTFRDYSAISAKIAQGVPADDVFKAMGIEQAIWDEMNVIWPKRMQEDKDFKLAMLMGQYFNDKHPKLSHLQPAGSEAGAGNLEKLRTDRYFYEELCGARQAAYEYGMDGAQWILDNYGINLGDFQAVAMEYMTKRNNDWNTEEIIAFQNYQESKQKEYAAKFAAEQGGNVADDVEF
jgi:hypothetical protein